jgi:transposase
MVRLLARVIGIGIETADMLVREILSRKLRDRRAVARYAGLTGSPDESGLKRREKGLAKAGNARVRRGLNCPRGKRLVAKVPHGHWKNSSVPTVRLLRRRAQRRSRDGASARAQPAANFFQRQVRFGGNLAELRRVTHLAAENAALRERAAISPYRSMRYERGRRDTNTIS